MSTPLKKMKIRVEIAEKPYRMTIYPHEEELVRRAAAKLQERIKKFQREYEASMIDYLSMAALGISIENEEAREQLKNPQATLRLQKMTEQLDQWLLDQQSADKASETKA